MLPAAGGEVKRNDPCPCGSGKKYKKCCLGKAVVASPPADEPVRTADSGDVTQKALAAHRAGQLDVAVALFRQVLKSKPRDANAMVRLGMVLRDRGEAKEAMKLIRRAIGISPRRADYHAGLSDVLFSIGQMDESLRSARRALNLNPRCVLAHRLEARWYERHNQLDKAITSIESAMSIEPGDTQVGLVWAQLQKRTGQLDEARERLEAIVGTETDHELLFRAWKDLSLVLDRLGEYDAAFEAMERGGDEKTKAAAGQRGDPDVLRRKIKSYREGITPELVGKWTRDALPDDLPAPAFLVGFPRSGTTMTEQVLAAHPQVETSGEYPTLEGVRNRLFELVEGVYDVPTQLMQLNADQISELRQVYWRDAESMFKLNLRNRVFVDKNPLNIIELGLINVLFPDAVVIVGLRDPRDACLSSYQQQLANPEFFEWNRIADFYTQVMGLWLHQRDMLTLKWIEVRYEDTVTDLEPQARRMLDLLGLPWDPAVLHFHERARTRSILTPSYAAVSQAVNTKAVGRWPNYPGPMAQVQPSLQPFAEAFGYE